MTRGQWISLSFGFLLLPFLWSCQKSIEKEYRRAEAEARNQNWRTALSLYDDILHVEPSSEIALKAARDGARIASLEVKDYNRAVPFYRHLVFHSHEPSETIVAQKQLIEIYFEQLQDYPRAIEEISRLLQVEKDVGQRTDYRVKLARSYFHMNNFAQASAELEEILRGPHGSEADFDLKLLKANVLTAAKKFDEAAVILRELMEKWREKAIQENVPMTLAVCFEEKGDFKSAIQVLESVKASHAVPEYVELRLKRLRERSLNQPGARGFKK